MSLNIEKIYRIVLSLFPAIALGYSTMFMHQAYTAKYLLAGLYAGLVLIITGLFLVTGEKNIKIYTQDYFAYLFLFYIIIHAYFSPDVSIFDFKNIVWISALCYFLSFSVYISEFKMNKLLYEIGISTLISTSIIITIGFVQFFNMRIAGLDFWMTSLFNNPGALGVYLVTQVPIVFYLYKKSANIKFKHALLTFIAIFILFVFLTRSRTAIIAFIGSVFIGLYYAFDLKLKARVFYPSVLLVLVIIASGSYFLSKDSANGRYLIWKVTLDTIYDNPFLGSGASSFSANYGNKQIEYFEKNLNEKDGFLADNPTYAFNEYLETTVEFGILGLFIFLFMILYSLITLKIKNAQTIIAYSGVIIFSIVSFFSYPISVLPTLFSLMLYLTMLKEPNDFRKVIEVQRLLKPIGLLALVIGILTIVSFGKRTVYYYDWAKAYSLFDSNRLQSIAQYNKVYPVLKENPNFLINYGGILSLSGLYSASNEVMMEAEKKSINENLLLLSGNNYECLGDLVKAEFYYKRAVLLTPSKLYPKYKLLKIYALTSPMEARELANTIVKSNVKVESEITHMIKMFAEEYLLQNHITEKPEHH